MRIDEPDRMTELADDVFVFERGDVFVFTGVDSYTDIDETSYWMVVERLFSPDQSKTYTPLENDVEIGHKCKYKVEKIGNGSTCSVGEEPFVNKTVKECWLSEGYIWSFLGNWDDAEIRDEVGYDSSGGDDARDLE